jgi:hypothetical protein
VTSTSGTINAQRTAMKGLMMPVTMMKPRCAPVSRPQVGPEGRYMAR